MTEAGKNLAHYPLVGKIGVGGMGVIWRADDRALHRPVPCGPVPLLRLDPRWDALRDDPSYPALIEQFSRPVRSGT